MSWYAGRADGDTLEAVFGQLAGFGIVGCNTTALSWCVFALLVHAGVAVLFPPPPAWTLGAVNSYALNRRWTFRSRGRYAPELVRFVAVQSAGLALDVVLVAALTRDAGVHELVAQPLVYPATTVATFALSRQWAFASVGRAGKWPV